MQYVVIETQPSGERCVFGPFAERVDARAYAQMLSDDSQEDGPGYKYGIEEMHKPTW